MPAVARDLPARGAAHLAPLVQQLSGALPDDLGDRRALKNLWPKGNRLSEAFPASVAVLPEFEYIDVHANDLSGPLPTCRDTPKLKIFRAEDNRISGALPRSYSAPAKARTGLPAQQPAYRPDPRLVHFDVSHNPDLTTE
jgi:hypothetical protein